MGARPVLKHGEDSINFTIQWSASSAHGRHGPNVVLRGWTPRRTSIGPRERWTLARLLSGNLGVRVPGGPPFLGGKDEA
jgi:hypothetical protein